MKTIHTESKHNSENIITRSGSIAMQTSGMKFQEVVLTHKDMQELLKFKPLELYFYMQNLAARFT